MNRRWILWGGIILIVVAIGVTVWVLRHRTTTADVVDTTIVPSSRTVGSPGSGNKKLTPKGTARPFTPIDQVPQATENPQPPKEPITIHNQLVTP